MLADFPGFFPPEEILSEDTETHRDTLEIDAGLWIIFGGCPAHCCEREFA